MDGVPLDALVTRLLTRSPFEYRLALDDADRELAYRLRGRVVVEQGWRDLADLPDGLEHDGYDDRAVHVIGWDGDAGEHRPARAPARALPTEDECGLVVEPPGGSSTSGGWPWCARTRSYQHAAFVGLLCRLYLEMRTRGYGVACGMMSPRARRPGPAARPAARGARARTGLLERAARAGAVHADRQHRGDRWPAAGRRADARSGRAEDQRRVGAAEAERVASARARRRPGAARLHGVDRRRRVDGAQPGDRRHQPGAQRTSASTTASTAPDPPIRCPVVPFTAVTGGRRRPNSATSASASARSLSTVLVPCALTCATSPASTPASARASRMQRSAPSPSGLGRDEVVGVAVDAVAERPTPSDVPPPPRRRGAREHHEPRALAHDEPVAVDVERPRRQLGLRRRCELITSSRKNEHSALYVTIESTPPASTRSAAPRRSSSTPSPIAVAPDAQAVDTVRHGPRNPNRSDSSAAVVLGMTIGIVERAAAPRSPPLEQAARAAPRRSRVAPSPTPQTTAHRSGGGSGAGHCVERVLGGAAMASWCERSNRRSSTGDRYAAGSKPSTRRHEVAPAGSRASSNARRGRAPGAQRLPTARRPCCRPAP